MIKQWCMLTRVTECHMARHSHCTLKWTKLFFHYLDLSVLSVFLLWCGWEASHKQFRIQLTCELVQNVDMITAAVQRGRSISYVTQVHPLEQRSPTDGPRENVGGPWRDLDIICSFYVYYTVSLYSDSNITLIILL
jgi:hypothetical protein